MLARSYGQAFATRLHKAVVLLPLVDNINIQRRFGCTCQSRHAAGKKLIHCNFTGEDDANSKGTPLSEVATHDDDLLIRRKRNASVKYGNIDSTVFVLLYLRFLTVIYLG